MAGLGYQAVQPANFDMTDIIQRQQAMEMEGAAMQARRAAAEAAKQKDFDKLEIQTPNRMHNALVTNWAMALMQEKKDIMGIADVNERAARTAEWNDKKQELAAFSNMSKEWGKSLSSIDKDVSTNKSKYTVEGINDYGKRLEQYQKDLISRASIRNGTLYIDDNPWTTSPNSIFTDIAPPETAQESFYFNFIDTFGKGVFDEQPADYRVFNQQKFNDTFEQAKAEAAKVGGSIEEIEATKDALFSYYSHDPQKVRATDKGGDGDAQNTVNIENKEYNTGEVGVDIVRMRGEKTKKHLGFKAGFTSMPVDVFTVNGIELPIRISELEYLADEDKYIAKGFGYKEGTGAPKYIIGSGMVQDQTTEPTEPQEFEVELSDLDKINRLANNAPIYQGLKKKSEIYTSKGGGETTSPTNTFISSSDYNKLSQEQKKMYRKSTFGDNYTLIQQ